MSKHKSYCLVPGHFSKSDFQAHSCHDGSHYHIDFGEAFEMLDHGLAQWLKFPHVLQLTNQTHLRGLSARVGWLLSVAVRERRSWALAMLAEIQRRREARVSERAAVADD